MARLFRLALLPLALLAGCSATRTAVPPPPQIDSPDLARGERAYMYYCDKCHPGGGKGLGPAIKNKPLPGFLIKAQVRAGLGAMPSFPDELLPDEHLNDLVKYIKEMKK